MVAYLALVIDRLRTSPIWRSLPVAAVALIVFAGCEELPQKPAERETGSIRVGSIPAGAKIYLDERDTGETTPVVLDVEPGSYTIILKKNGLSWARADVKISVGETYSITDAVLVNASGVQPMSKAEYERQPLLEPPFPPMAADNLPGRVDLSTYAPLAGHQGSQGSCAAWAVAYLKTIQEKQERDWSLDILAHQMSPAFLYNQLNNGVDYGITIHHALNIAQALGVSSLSTMPYDPADHTTQPSSEAIAEASRYKVDEWSRIVLDRDWETEFKLILYNEIPIVVAMVLYADFYVELPENPTYNSDHGSPVGYHAVLVVGYDDSRKAFKYLNSWGTDYGDEGYGWLTYSLAQRVVGQAYYAVDVVDGQQPQPVGDTSPDFGDKAIGDKTFIQGVSIAPVTLPTARGGDGSVSYSLSGSVPPGLSLSGRTLSGAPVQSGTYHVTYTASDRDGDTDSLSFTITIVEHGPAPVAAPVLPSISDKAYPIGDYVSEALPAATGGDGTLVYSLTPSIRGLTFDASSRTLYGTPREAGTYHMRYRVQDEDGDTDSQSFTVTVQAQEQDTAPVLPSINDKAYPIGEYVSEALPAATGGNGRLTYDLTPSIPGLTFDAATRTLYGTPREAGTYHMRYRVQDDDTDTDSQSFTVIVQAQDTTPVLPSIGDKAYPIGDYVSEALPAATGGDGRLSYSLEDRTYVTGEWNITGLTFDPATRTLYGTPTPHDPGRYYMKYLVQDEDGDTDAQSFTIFNHYTAPEFLGLPVSDLTFTKGRRITALTLPVASNAGVLNETLSYSLTPSVPGLTFDTGTRKLRGTPTAADTYHMTYRVQDESGDSDSHAFVIIVQEPSPPEPSGGEKRLYWTDSGTSIIWRAYLDGTAAEPVVTGRLSGGSNVITIFDNKMYWTNWHKLHRANLDGSVVETIAEGEVYDISTDGQVSFRAGIRGIAISGSKLYWTGGVNSHNVVTAENLEMAYIHRANLDGSNVEEIVPDTGRCCFVQIAIADDKMYLVGYGKIQRANLDGTGIEAITATSFACCRFNNRTGITISEGKIYWTDSDSKEIQRANLDGTGIETLLERTSSPNGIAISEGKIYWSDNVVVSGLAEDSVRRIRRANIDGSGVETLVSYIGGAVSVHIAIRPEYE